MQLLLHDIIDFVVTRNANDLLADMRPSLHDLVKHRKVQGTVERKPVCLQDEIVVFAEPVAILVVDLFISIAETRIDTRQISEDEVLAASSDRIIFRRGCEREAFAVLLLHRIS